MKLQEHLREAIAWVEKGYVSKEEYEVLKHKIFLEDKERRVEANGKVRHASSEAAAAKRAQEQVEKLLVENARLKVENDLFKKYSDDPMIDCPRDGVYYRRNGINGTVYNYDADEVGKWCSKPGWIDGFIEFSNEGAKQHFAATGRSLPN